MASRAKLVAGAVLALLGLGLAVVGVWFTAHLGASGSGSFTLRPTAAGVYLLDPSVLNRLDTPVRVRATAAPTQRVWLGVTAPSDARAVLGTAAHTTVTGVSVPDWSLTATTAGSGAPGAITGADLWQRTATGTGGASLAVGQRDAPQSVVVTDASGAPVALRSLTLTWQRGTWFFQALVATLAGLIALVAGGAIARQAARPPSRTPSTPEETR